MIRNAFQRHTGHESHTHSKSAAGRRFGAQGVGFPVQLLDEEVQAFADFAALFQQAFDFIQMRLQPRDFFRHIDANGKSGGFSQCAVAGGLGQDGAIGEGHGFLPALHEALAEEALTALLSAREREGKRLAAMVLDRAKQLRALAQQAVPLVPLLVEQQRQRFMERWKEAMALTDGSTLPEAARDRALTEATAFAIRIDVAEEITRLNSHLDEIERLLQKGGEVGKRLDFLIQELHREANTLGSKSAALDLTRISVDMKVLIEQMREQVQNIE